MAEHSTDATNTAENGVQPAFKELEGFDISPQQRRIWLLQRHTDALYARVVLELQGDLDVGQARSAVKQLTDKHEILRTNFVRVPGRVFPVQVVHSALPPDWQEIDLEPLPTQAQSDRVREFLDERPASPLSLEKGSLVQAKLLRLSGQRHLLSLSLPSLCADTASLHTLVKELAAFYSAEPADAGLEPLQYADLADWQNELLAQENQGEAGHAYWRQQASGASALSLPFEKEPEEGLPLRTDVLSLRLDPALEKRLHEAAAQRDVLPAALLAGCWQGLLSRVSDAQEAPLLYASEGRPDADLQGAVGPLARWLPLRVGFDASIPMGRLWRRINTAITEARRWEHYWNWKGFPPEGEAGEASPAPIGFRIRHVVGHFRGRTTADLHSQPLLQQRTPETGAWVCAAVGRPVPRLPIRCASLSR